MATLYARQLLGLDSKRGDDGNNSNTRFRSVSKSTRYRPNLFNPSYEYDEDAATTYYPKSLGTKRLLEHALNEHYLFSQLAKRDVTEVVNAMKKKLAHSNDTVITQGTEGDLFYILEEGTCEAYVNGKSVKKYASGESFGELALLHSCPRAASVIATSHATLWTLNRATFKRTLQNSKVKDTIKRCEFLKKVPNFKTLTNQEIGSIAGVIELEMYEKGNNVVREGETGDKFYIIQEGECSALKNSNGEVITIGTLNTGDFFGETAIITHEPRNATVQVTSDTALVLSLSKSDFETVLGPLKHLMDDVRRKRRDDTANALKRHSQTSARGDSRDGKAGGKTGISLPATADLSILWEDLKFYATLGTGTFGRVKLVEHKPTNRAMALKAMQKSQVVRAHQAKNVCSEKDTMLMCNHPFVIKLYRTFQDQDSIYMLLELVQGGELWSLLYQSKALRRTRIGCGGFEPDTSKFYAACVVSAFEHIHSFGIAYRDLKPENLLLAANGYLKVVDFGFAKRLPYQKKGKILHETFTLCGTPEYLSPELVKQTGHNRGVDWWACGILIHELLHGETPFCDDNQHQMFKMIMQSKKYLKVDQRVEASGNDIINKLLEQDAARRFGTIRGGVEDVKNHPWFSTIDWERLVNQELAAPFVPTLKNALDTSMFDPYDENDHVQSYKGDNSPFETF
jgi:CRP-like cAMP-binding protein